MSKERFEIIDDIICDDGKKMFHKAEVCKMLNQLNDSRNHHKQMRMGALKENELLWQVVDGFKAFLELSFEGKI